MKDCQCSPGHILRRACVLLASCALALTGCSRDKIIAYQIPKEQDTQSSPTSATGSDPHGGMGMDLAAMTKVNYKLPDGWKENPNPGSMRSASFTIAGPNGDSADVAVIPLSVMSGQETDVFNFWRSEVKLPPLSETELVPTLQAVKVGSRDGRLMEAVSTEALGEGKSKARLLVAILSLPAMRWNIRMIGADELVASQKDKFIEFLKSLSFEMSAPPMAMAPAGAPGAAASQTLPKWQVPADWKPEPPGQMLLATFGIADDKLGSASVTVSSFPGDVGGVLANVNRWRNQVGLGPIEESALDQNTTLLDLAAGKAILVDVTGSKQTAEGKHTRLIGAMVPHDGETWFFKLMGDDSVATKQRDAFFSFLKSVSFETPAASAPAAPIAENTAASGLPAWRTPAHWKAQPPGQMLLATFAIEDGPAGQATLTVSSFPGDVGGVFANVNRWRNQVGLGPIAESALDQNTTSLDLAAGKAILVDVTGSKQTAEGKNSRLIGAMLPQGGQTWFFKLLGDETAAAKEKDAFLDFLKSLDFTHAH